MSQPGNVEPGLICERRGSAGRDRGRDIPKFTHTYTHRRRSQDDCTSNENGHLGWPTRSS